ncbi:hypothetical protein AB0L00_09365 [Actinoallomurus sp. NPDC052308]|uniref:DUF6891 domain-containing protein n=1 Tax=Actinoallomurus sp. NPDC052308 TaxID=3155530 RepID=UPI003446A519
MIDTADQDELRNTIREALAIGDLDFDAIIEDCVEYLHGVAEADTVRAAATEIATEEFAAYRSDQETWPDVLDADRLIRAFRELETAGIIARENFTCCQSCGTAEIGGEAPEGAEPRGYVFCHHQDVQAAVGGHGVYLSYGAFGGDEAATTRIGEEIVAVLRRHGLTPDWNGDSGRRIAVPLTWRRRRFGRLAAWPGGPEPENAGPLMVTYRDYARGRGEDDAVPMPLAAARRTLLDLTPRKGNFATFEGRSGAIVQMIWEDGPRLWLESPDVATRSSRGRHVTPAEAEDLIRVLAEEDRADLARLGDIEVRPWSTG